MTPSLLLFILRVLMGVVMFAFLAYMLITLRRDLRQQTPIPALPPRAQLVVQRGIGDQVAYPLEDINLIGRAADNTIVFSDELVSAHHARVSYVSGQQWWLEDLASRNGTQVNGMPVEQPLVVTDGDEIIFGAVTCELTVEKLDAIQDLPQLDTDCEDR